MLHLIQYFSNGGPWPPEKSTEGQDCLCWVNMVPLPPPPSPTALLPESFASCIIAYVVNSDGLLQGKFLDNWMLDVTLLCQSSWRSLHCVTYIIKKNCYPFNSKKEFPRRHWALAAQFCLPCDTLQSYSWGRFFFNPSRDNSGVWVTKSPNPGCMCVCYLANLAEKHWSKILGMPGSFRMKFVFVRLFVCL